MNTSDLRQKIRSLAEPTVEKLGYDLVAVEWLSDVRGQILRISIDRRGGIGANDCERVSHHVSQLLDEHDPIESAYRLEVSSPGIERPLQRLVDFSRFQGFRAKVRLVAGPRRRMSGVLAGVEGDQARIEVDGQILQFPVDAVDRAYLVLDLEEYLKLAETPGDEPGLTEGAPQASEDSESDHDHQ
jgi:ribosome maturation factor RimP